jgi:glyoxylase-like metal-dependent hydrolase (beta-lactamase superfamily II)
MMPRRALLIHLATVLLGGAATLGAQERPFSVSLLPAVRRAAGVIPGDPPTALNVVALNEFWTGLAGMVEGGSKDSVLAAFPVFQIRFPRGWIVVDAAMGREFVPKSTTFSDEKYDRIQQALRGANLVVVTHEHHDHVAGVIRSPYLAEIQRHTLLTRAQIESLRRRSDNPRIKLDSAMAARYLAIDYDPYVPIAPGVVLIRAAGHTPGSQMVYVRLASGQELIIAGDVVWHTSGITTQRQKPAASTRDFGGEDRAAIARQLRWLRDLPPEVAVIVSHDQAAINDLLARGVLHDGVDLNDR